MFERSEKKARKVSLTPMIDMVFLLLVFFMITTTFQRNDGITLNFGLPEQGSNLSEKKLIRVMANNDGTMLLQGTPQEAEFFTINMRELLQNFPDHQIILSTDETATVQQMLTALDAINKAGSDDVTIVESIRELF